MAAKKKAKKKPKPVKPYVRRCTPADICKFLDKLNIYLAALDADYTRLRKAVCNVEDQAFGGGGVPTKPPRFCTGGSTLEPAPPPPPPVW
jgi:hypothetical protein